MAMAPLPRQERCRPDVRSATVHNIRADVANCTRMLQSAVGNIQKRSATLEQPLAARHAFLHRHERRPVASRAQARYVGLRKAIGTCRAARVGELRCTSTSPSRTIFSSRAVLIFGISRSVLTTVAAGIVVAKLAAMRPVPRLKMLDFLRMVTEEGTG